MSDKRYRELVRQFHEVERQIKLAEKLLARLASSIILAKHSIKRAA